MIKAVIFDVGGVLHFSSKFDFKKDICEEMGVTEEQYLDACQKLIPIFGINKIDEKQFWEQFIILTKSKKQVPTFSLWSREFERKWEENKETTKIVEKLKEKGLKVAILSNTIEPHAKINREKKIYDLFPVVILSHEVGVRKPDRKVFEIALKKLGVRAEEAIFIDDEKPNVDAAKKLGINGIVFENSNQLEKDLKSFEIL